MHVTACLAGQDEVEVEVGEECRTLQALKETIVVALPKLCVEGFDVSVGGRGLDDDEGVVSLDGSEELESDELRKSKTGVSLGLWIGKFRPHSFYPSSEVRGARAQHWFDEAAAISERCKRYLPREQIMENAPPAEAPASAVRGDARVHTCVAHRKPFCQKCLEKYRKDKHTSLATCCYEHHREDDGQAPIWDFCTTHRLTRCGACVHDKNRPSLEHCCNRHHGCRGQRKITSMFAPKAPLKAGVDPNGRTTTDERVGEPPHTPIADPHG